MDLDTLRTHVPIEPRERSEPLEQVIAENFSVPESHVHVANSSLALLRGLLNRVEDPVMLPMPDYFEFPRMCRIPSIVPRLPNYAPMIASQPAVLLSNPNNPTGTVHDLSKLAEHTRRYGHLLIVDEAYMEFTDERHSLAPLVREYDNLIVLRTMSKLYGMTEPGGRVGYALANPRLMKNLEVEDATPEAREIAAGLVGHPDVPSVIRDVGLRRGALVNHLKTFYCEVIPSETHFVMARGKGYDLHAAMERTGIDVVSLDKTPGLRGEGYCRIAVPSREEMRRFAGAWAL